MIFLSKIVGQRLNNVLASVSCSPGWPPTHCVTENGLANTVQSNEMELGAMSSRTGGLRATAAAYKPAVAGFDFRTAWVCLYSSGWPQSIYASLFLLGAGVSVTMASP